MPATGLSTRDENRTTSYSTFNLSEAHRKPRFRTGKGSLVLGKHGNHCCLLLQKAGWNPTAPTSSRANSAPHIAQHRNSHRDISHEGKHPLDTPEIKRANPRVGWQDQGDGGSAGKIVVLEAIQHTNRISNFGMHCDLRQLKHISPPPIHMLTGECFFPRKPVVFGGDLPSKTCRPATQGNER